MTASALWSDTPKNRHAAERMGATYTRSETRDAFASRRHTTVLLAGIFLLMNLAALAALTPVVVDAVTSMTALSDLSAPQR